MEAQKTDYWHYDVLSDLSKALRRDGFAASAEMIEDAMVIMALEVRRKNPSAKLGGAEIPASGRVLPLVTRH